MCFAQTIFARFDELQALCARIDETCIATMPMSLYSRGCHLISTVAAQVFRNHGIDSARACLCALTRPDGLQTPHYVVRVGRCTFE